MRTSFQWTAIGLAVLALESCRSTVPLSAAGPEQKAGVGVAPAQKPKQKVFPWSVVSGGVDSATAMRAAMQEDPVVEAHYAGLNPAFFQAEVLPAKRQGYVSYRIRDKIYWTRKKVTLQTGETVLSDGQFLVRGRCGNLISATPREPVAPAAMEPEEPAMDQPVPGAQLMYSPPLHADRVIETGSLQNPKQIGTNAEMTAVLPPPDSEEMLPPVWTTGGGSGGGFGGIIGTTGSGGTPSTPPTSPPGSPSPEIPAPSAPIWTQTPPIEIPPPLVIASLAPLPGTSTVPMSPVVPGYYWPGYTWEHPGMPVHPPLPPYSPPPPQISYPPPDVPPPSTPPPGTPPPSTPPPSGPPPGDHPTFDPPSSPPDSPPDESPIPEPGPWILFALGLAGLAVGTVRRKY
jgi:hypothetical protein